MIKSRLTVTAGSSIFLILTERPRSLPVKQNKVRLMPKWIPENKLSRKPNSKHLHHIDQHRLSLVISIWPAIRDSSGLCKQLQKLSRHLPLEPSTLQRASKRYGDRRPSRTQWRHPIPCPSRACRMCKRLINFEIERPFLRTVITCQPTPIVIPCPRQWTMGSHMSCMKESRHQSQHLYIYCSLMPWKQQLGP